MALIIPLRNPVTEVGSRDLERQHRTMLVPGIGPEGLARLRAARVLVVGAGGLGSPVILYLTAAGVGHLSIGDNDVVEEQNLQRQIIHAEPDVGQAKVASAIASAQAIDSATTLHPLGLMTPENLPAAVADHDLVLDCTDTFGAKYAIADACDAAGVPLVWGTIVAMTYQVSVFWSHLPADITPVRLRDLHPAPPPEGSVPGSREIGVLGPVVGQAGSVMATEAVKLITGVGEPLYGRVLVADAAVGRWDVVPFRPRPASHQSRPPMTPSGTRPA